MTTLLSDGGDPHKMAPSDANRLSFGIDLTNDCVEIRYPTDRWRCELNAHELELFLKKYKRSRVELRSREERQGECFEWLCKEMRSGPQQGIKSHYLHEAKRRNGISDHDFEAAWSKAVILKQSRAGIGLAAQSAR